MNARDVKDCGDLKKDDVASLFKWFQNLDTVCTSDLTLKEVNNITLQWFGGLWEKVNMLSTDQKFSMV